LSVDNPIQFYDAASREATNVEDSPWFPVYEEAARYIGNGAASIVELGCGTGRFAKLLMQREHAGEYIGLDISPACIKAAQDYVQHPNFRFEVADLRAVYSFAPADRPIAGHTTYVCLEVLEHLADDLELVSRIPTGHTFIFSVPTHPSQSHIRTFPNVSSVWARYQEILFMKRWALIDCGSGRAIHVVQSTKRSDSWL